MREAFRIGYNPPQGTQPGQEVPTAASGRPCGAFIATQKIWLWQDSPFKKNKTQLIARPVSPEDFRGQFAECVMAGASFISYFSIHTVESGIDRSVGNGTGWSWDETQPEIVEEMRKQHANLEFLQRGCPEGNVLMDPRTGIPRTRKFRRAATVSGNPNISSERLVFNPPKPGQPPMQLPGPFSGCEITVGAERFRIVRNLLRSTYHLSDQAWSLSDMPFGPREWKVFRVSDPATNILPH
jgi:hypothetical protein